MPAGISGGADSGAVDMDEVIELEGERARQIRNIGILVASVVAAVLGVFFLFQLAAPSGDDTAGDKVDIPNVIEMTQDNALATLSSYGLEGNVKGEANPDVPVGLVIRTDPVAGIEVTKGTIVTVVVSTGATEATVPTVRGLTQDEAEARIEAAGLVVAEVIEDHSDPVVDAGRVVGTEPEEGAIVAPDAEITIYVSSGKVQLPDVEGLREDDAAAALLTVQLPYEVEEVQTDSEPPGTVLSQTPLPGLVDQGTGVILRVAVPVVMVAVPDVAGDSESIAIAAIRSAGLVESVTYNPVGSGTPGAVLSQSPLPGTLLAEGDTVTIDVYDPPDPSPTPTPTPSPTS